MPHRIVKGLNKLISRKRVAHISILDLMHTAELFFKDVSTFTPASSLCDFQLLRILTSTGIILLHQTINKEVKSSAPLLCAKCHLKAFREL